MEPSELQARIEALVAAPEGARTTAGAAIDEVIAALDSGRLRVSEPAGDGWVTHAWIKSAILLYFSRMDVRAFGDPQPFGMPVGVDKLPLKTNFAAAGVRCVPGGVVRYGSYLGRGVIVMPSFVNIGAHVDEGSMVDTWATVGSCAQIGKHVHLSGGVGIGGVLEPPQAQPVVIEDGAFIGSRCIVVEGVRVGREAVLGAGVTITASTPIVDVRGAAPVTARGLVPARSVVIPGTFPKRFPAGEYGTPCALIIGTRSESTDRKTSLNATLREYELAV
ncbi:MAG: 2,3,4,5-tetrahydropyridine-2,6-dicarboxylate N-succinyltransferase [Candidatus Velthaea sp.]|jgi:2,3,4,5-tetrahydropyridine-2-carboxylate N-succinyltransferase